MAIVRIIVVIFLAHSAFGTLARAQEEVGEKPVTLMGMLHPWMYPESKFGGAQMSDAGVTDIMSIKCKALMTTPDPVAKVLDFYCEKLEVDRDGKRVDEQEGERLTSDHSVLIQNAGGGDEQGPFLISINRPDASTTLVISRNEADDQTRVAWSNFRKLGP